MNSSHFVTSRCLFPEVFLKFVFTNKWNILDCQSEPVVSQAIVLQSTEKPSQSSFSILKKKRFSKTNKFRIVEILKNMFSRFFKHDF